MSDIHTELFELYLRGKSLLNGSPRFYLLKEMNREQWLSSDELNQIRLKRLRALLDRAMQSSRYYQKKFDGIISGGDDITDIGQLSRLPLLRRQDVQENNERILCPGRPGIYKDASGGSTGTPVNFWHDAYYKAYSDAMEMLFLSWHGLKRGDRTAIMWGAERDFHKLSFKETVAIKYMERIRYLNAFNVSEAILDDFLSELERFKPEFLYGYASSLHIAAQYILKTGKFNFNARAVKSSAEMIYDHQRMDIEKAFNAPVFNFYGSREVNNLAAQCSVRDGLHVFGSARIVEIVDDDGNPLPPGQVGQIAVTDLTNLTFPFIRYLNGDMGSLKEGTCSCGRSYPMLESITGRQYDVIVLGGNHIHGQFFTNLFYGQPDVRHFQVVQDEVDKITVKIVAPNKQFDRDDMTARINKQAGKEIKIIYEFVDEIPVLSSGKYRFTINNTVKSLKG